jgi:pyrimidine-nucleoside phosphorylase
MAHFRAADIITKKRDSRQLSREEIEFFINGYVAGEIPDYQVSAWLMAVFFNGMAFEETACLTDVMLRSGSVIELHGYEKDGLAGPFIDKHSTGGVGDKLSLPLAPMVAACGVRVPMMSGRALGHTGGTLDKLESIAGYNVFLSPDEFRAFMARTGFAMTGQTKEIVPADRLLYALRDVTGTVESIPLITASILSKKVAEGADGFVFDVKAGSGAFMKNVDDAQKLAVSLVETARQMGKKAAALITNMNKPLGRKIGNFLEIEETVECLQGNWQSDVREITFALGARMLTLGGRARSVDEGIALCQDAVSSGKALALFLQNIKDQGGNPQTVLAECGRRRSPHRAELRAERCGILRIDALMTGLAGVALGVGRNKTQDAVCPDAGMIIHAPEGSGIQKGDLIMEVFGKDDESLEPALSLLSQAVLYQEHQPDFEPLIYKEIT